MTGTKAPPLKRINDWLRENPLYDIDPKWADLVKEKGVLAHDLQKRLPPIDRKKGPGRPPILASPPTSVATSISSGASSLPTSLASNLQFSLASAAGLSGINPSSLLSGLNFDKANLLLPPFAGVPNMNALSGMSGLGNMNLFANLASLGMGGLAGMDGSSLSGGDHGNSSTAGTSSGGVGSTAGLKSSKSRKQQQQESANSAGTGSSSSAGASASSNSKAPSVSAASALPSSMPFFFHNPNLLYGPLGLTGLNPFMLQAGSMPQYDNLGLLNGGLGGITSSGSASNTTTSRHKTSTSGGSRSTAMVSSSSALSTASPSVSASGSQRQSSSRSATPHSQQFQLPPDSHLLDTLTKQRTGADTSLSSSAATKNRMREVDSLRTLISHIGGSPFNFAGLSVDPKKLKDHELLENLHQKFPVDLFGRLPTHTDDRKSTHGSSDLMEKLLKRSAPSSSIDLNMERPPKRSKESSSSAAAAAAAAAAAGINVPAMSKLFSSNNVTVTAESIPSAGIDLSSAGTGSSDRGGKEVTSGASILDCRSSSPATTSALSRTISPVSKVKSSGASIGAMSIVAETRSKTPPVPQVPVLVQTQPAPSPSPPPPSLPPPDYTPANDTKTIADEPPSLLPPAAAPSPFSAEELASKVSTAPPEPEKVFSADVATDSAEESEAADPKMEMSDDVDDQKTDSGAAAGMAPEEQSLAACSSESQRSPASLDKEDGGANRKRKPRNKKNPIAPEEAIERKNLRSSAGRAAAVAAARAARAAAAAQDESADDRKDDESLSGL